MSLRGTIEDDNQRDSLSSVTLNAMKSLVPARRGVGTQSIAPLLHAVQNDGLRGILRTDDLWRDTVLGSKTIRQAGAVDFDQLIRDRDGRRL